MCGLPVGWIPDKTRAFVIVSGMSGGENSIVNEVTTEKWVYGGETLARVPEDGHPGRVILIPFVLPGETVRARLIDDIHAEVEKILTPSPDRVTPPCPLFERCGGCHYQHAPYEYQVARKVEILREQLLRVGKLRFEGEIVVVSGPP